mgnify:CR=1 FL=1
MERDRFEEYIIDKRSEVDSKNPPESSWLVIEQRLSKQSKPSYLRYWQVAAVIFFVVSIGLFVKSYQTTAYQGSSLVQEFTTTEEYYFNTIEDQQGVLTSYLQEYPDLAHDFKADLEDLSLNYKKLKADFGVTGDSQVLNALIQNLQLQQELLNNQLKVIRLIEKENENVSI